MGTLVAGAAAMTKPQPDVFMIDELAEYLQVSKSTLYKLAQDRRVPGQKVGKHWRFHRENIDDWLKQRPKEAGQ